MIRHRPDGEIVAQTLVGVSFENSFRAEEFVTAARGLAATGQMKLKDAVTIVKDDAGRTVVALLVEDLDRDALVAETARFTGAELLYANLDDLAIDRIKAALDPPVLSAHKNT